MASIVLGIDGGGTSTRVLCAGLDGTVLSYVEGGGTNPSHNADAQLHMQSAIREAILQAGRRPADVAALVAGIAGLNRPDDQRWASEQTALEGLTCPRIHRNDTDVAHAGAFGAGPGVIAVAGTGSAIMAVTEDGRRLDTDLFHHYAGAARHFAFHTMQQLLLGAATADDAAFVAEILRFWGASSLDTLRAHVIEQAANDYREIKRQYGAMAQIVTAAAVQGSPLAGAACDHLAEAITTGIRLLGNCFAGDSVPVVLVGGLARSIPLQDRIAELLRAAPDRGYQIIEAALPPVAGAALLALTQIEVTVDAALKERMKETLGR
jgi:glucosamine kinase